MEKKSFFKNYASSLYLLSAVFVGAIVGIIFKEKTIVLKPIGDVFLNLLFMVVIPVVFFSISSAISNIDSAKRLKKIFITMILLFTGTGIISAALMVVGVIIFPPAQGMDLDVGQAPAIESMNIAQQLVNAFTVSDFVLLLSRKNMLALIVFALLIGWAANISKEKGRVFREFLVSGNDVMMRVVLSVMKFAPLGLGAYFAYLVGTLGPQLLGSYMRAMLLYYPISILYFFIGFSIYAYLADSKRGVKSFWANIIPAALTALGTGSSVATIPTNLEAAKKIGVPEDIREMVIPIGATIHMDGSCLSAILKIAVLFGIYHMPFSSPQVIMTAMGIALLSGVVMSGIPGGGFLGELLIVTFYGFPPESLVIISMIGTLVDPPATMVNSTGDTICSMMASRILDGKKWVSA